MRDGRWLRLVAAATFAVFGMCGVARAQDLAPALGPLAASVGLGTSGSWTILTDHGRVVLSNQDEGGALRYYTTPWQGDRIAGRSAGVRVQAVGMGNAAGGLIYNVRDSFPRWIALVVTADKQLVVYARQQTGVVEAKRMALPGGVHADGELLQVSERGGTTTLFANGVSIGELTLAAPGQAPQDNPVGIVAVAPGRIAFRDFAFGQAVVPRAGGDDRVPGRPGPVAGNDDRIPSHPQQTPDQPPAPAPTPATEARRWPVPRLDPLASDLLGASMGILAHEFGHFMIGELQIPATGPEEDVADEFAAMVFVDNMRDMPEQAAGMALSMAKFWWYSAQDGGEKHQPPWFDEHAPDRMRFAQIMCMLYGAAPQMFEQVMQQTGIPERTRARCIDDERKRHAAWDRLLRDHRRQGVDPVMPGTLAASTPGGTVTVEFQEPKTPQFKVLESFLQRSHMLETAAALLTKLYVLPRDTKIVVRECGQVNCFYRPSDGSVTMCYEMLAYVLQTFARHEGTGTTDQQKPTATPASTTPSTTPTPTTPTPTTPTPGEAAGKTMNLAQFLAGTWQLQQRADNGVVDEILVEAHPDGTYRARHDAGIPGKAKLVVGVVGRWSATPAPGPRMFDLTLTPVQWSPREVCGQAGNCQPLNLPPTHVRVQIVDRNTLASDQGQATRVQ